MFCGQVSEQGDVCRDCAAQAGRLRIDAEAPREENGGRRLSFVDGVCAAYRYEDGAAEIVRRFKFRSNEWLAAPMARACAACVQEQGMRPELVVAVPSAEKERRHGEQLARRVAALLGCAYDGGALRKLRRTRKQHDLNEEERGVNLEDAFWADDLVVKGRAVLLCDDVITTGNTANECAKALRRAGAAAVWVCAFAATPRRKGTPP